MKSEAEIAKHHADLQALVNAPCECSNHGHAFACARGREMMLGAIAVLSWALDKNDGHDRIVEDMSAAAKRG